MRSSWTFQVDRRRPHRRAGFRARPPADPHPAAAKRTTELNGATTTPGSRLKPIDQQLRDTELQRAGLRASSSSSLRRQHRDRLRLVRRGRCLDRFHQTPAPTAAAVAAASRTGTTRREKCAPPIWTLGSDRLSTTPLQRRDHRALPAGRARRATISLPRCARAPSASAEGTTSPMNAGSPARRP